MEQGLQGLQPAPQVAPPPVSAGGVPPPAGASLHPLPLPLQLQPPSAVGMLQTPSAAPAAQAPAGGAADVVKLFAFFTSEFRHFLGHIEQSVQAFQATGQLPAAPLYNLGQDGEYRRTEYKPRKPRKDKVASGGVDRPKVQRAPRKPTAFNHFVKKKIKELRESGVVIEDDKNNNEMFKMAVGEWGNMTQEEKIAFGQQIKKEEEQGQGLDLHGTQSLDGHEDDIDVEGDDGAQSPRLATDAELLHSQAASAQQRAPQLEDNLQVSLTDMVAGDDDEGQLGDAAAAEVAAGAAAGEDMHPRKRRRAPSVKAI